MPHPKGDLLWLDALVLAHAPTPPHANGLLQVLRQVQARYQHIPAWVADHLVQRWGLQHTDIRSLVGFYHFLSLEPRGRYCLYLSDSPTDHMLGAQASWARLSERLGVPLNSTRADGLVSLHTTSCTGLCDQGPAALINGQPLVALTPERADQIADLILAQVPLSEWPATFMAVHNPIRHRDLTLQHTIEPGDAIRHLLAQPQGTMLHILKASGLRGRGGAGFATWQKWKACALAPGPRAITCNADEGEPGTFKDRLLLMQWAHECIEGMTLAALAVGATQGFIYLRGEYEFIEPHLREVLQARRDLGLLGHDILGTAHPFDITLHLGAGAYVCGEETALIESVEGKRGIPRSRPPFPVDRGYLGLPTVNNNVETFVQVAQIAWHGAEWFRTRGTALSPGTRILSVAGDVALPGLFEVPWGITVAQVLAMAGATDVQAVLVGGPSGHLIPASQAHRQLSFEDLPTGGAFTVFNQQRDLIEVARQYTHFFARESCGFCTPCRVGCGQLVKIADRLASHQASERDLTLLQETGELMGHISHCGLGQTAAHPLLDVLQHFPQRMVQGIARSSTQSSAEALP